MNSNDINARTIRAAKAGDTLVITRDRTNFVGLYTVQARCTARGRNGSTTLTLINTMSKRPWTFQVNQRFLRDVSLVRLVSRGTKAHSASGAAQAQAVEAAAAAPNASVAGE